MWKISFKHAAKHFSLYVLGPENHGLLEDASFMPGARENTALYALRVDIFRLMLCLTLSALHLASPLPTRTGVFREHLTGLYL